MIVSGAYGGYIRPFDSGRKRVAVGSGSGDHSVDPYAEGLRVTGAYHICAVSRGSIPRGGKLVKAECLLFFKLFLRLGSLRLGNCNAQRQNGEQRCGDDDRALLGLRRFLCLFSRLYRLLFFLRLLYRLRRFRGLFGFRRPWRLHRLRWFRLLGRCFLLWLFCLYNVSFLFWAQTCGKLGH